MRNLLALWREWCHRKTVFSQLARIDADTREVEKFKLRDDLAAASSAIARGEPAVAEQIWAMAAARYPDGIGREPLALLTLIGLRRFEEASALMSIGLQAHPNDSFYLEGLAKIALARSDYSNVNKYCRLLMQGFPGHVSGYIMAATAFRATGNLHKASELARKATEIGPEDLAGYLEYARVAEDLNDWVACYERWEQAREKFDHVLTYVGAAKALARLQRLEEADHLLNQAIVKFPTATAPMAELARSMEARGLIQHAIECWIQMPARYPLDVHVYCDAAHALKRLGLLEQAISILAAAIDRFPTDKRPRAQMEKFANS